MTVKEKVELHDPFIYCYVGFGILSCILSFLFIIIISYKWSTISSDAVNPSQHKYRNSYIISIVISFFALFLYSIVIGFGLSDIIVPWNYDEVDDIYERVIIFLMSFGAATFWSFSYIAYLQRVQIIFNLSNSSKLLNNLCLLFELLWLVFTILFAVGMGYEGFLVGHHHDMSTGIILLRPRTDVMQYSFFYVTLPLAIISTFILIYIYSLQIKKRNIDNLQSLPIIIKECILMTISTLLFIIWTSLMAFGDTKNMALTCSFFTFIMSICSFFTFDFRFNNMIFFGFCNFCSIQFLKYCCCSYQNGDDQLFYQQNKVYNKINPDQEDVDDDTDQETDINQQDI